MRTQVLINDNLSLTRASGEPRYLCGCGLDLAPGDVNFKNGCVVKESPVDAIGPDYTSFDIDMMNKMCFREFFCPACGARLATEVAQVGDDYLWDIEIRL
jgi:acetone carboxylase gamma subunit